MQISKRVVIQTHTASAARVSAIKASAVRVSATTASAVRASADTTTADTAIAPYVQRMKGGRFRRGGCVCVSGVSKKRMDHISNQSLIQPSNHPT